MSQSDEDIGKEISDWGLQEDERLRNEEGEALSHGRATGADGKEAGADEKNATEPDFTCWFGSFGKYRNRTERTDTELRRYRIFCGTDRYRFSLEPNLPRYRGTEPIGSVVPNAQSDLSRNTTKSRHENTDANLATTLFS